MNELTFNILKIVVSVAAALVATYLVPYIKAKTAETKYERLLHVVATAVRAAEQTIKGSDKGSLKKEEVMGFVTSWMAQHGIGITEEQLDQLVESAVYSMNKNPYD